MKHQKENKMTFTLDGVTFTDPYSVIAEVFSAADIQSYRRFVTDILLYSSSKKLYQKERFGGIMYYLDRLSCLLEAGFAIRKQVKKCHLDVRNEDLLNRHFYSLSEATENAWAGFPRSLTRADFFDPYKALKKVFKVRNPDTWSFVLKEMADFACGYYWEATPDNNTLEVYLSISKLLEATHLIYVREIAQPDKWRSQNKSN